MIRKSEKSIRDMSLEERQKIADSLTAQKERLLTVVEKITMACSLEETAADALREVIIAANADLVPNMDDRLYLAGNAASLLLEAIKQRGSIHNLLENFKRKVERLESEIDDILHPEKYDIFNKEG